MKLLKTIIRKIRNFISFLFLTCSSILSIIPALFYLISLWINTEESVVLFIKGLFGRFKLNLTSKEYKVKALNDWFQEELKKPDVDIDALTEAYNIKLKEALNGV